MLTGSGNNAQIRPELFIRQKEDQVERVRRLVLVFPSFFVEYLNKKGFPGNWVTATKILL